MARKILELERRTSDCNSFDSVDEEEVEGISH